MRRPLLAAVAALSARHPPVCLELRGASGAQRLAELWEAKRGEHAWLEEVQGDEALGWVRAQNARALAAIGDPAESPLYERVYSILTDKAKIPYLRKIGGAYYNFWTDDANPRGVWRRTDLQSYARGEPEWETVLSVDELGAKEGESWVWKGHALFKPVDGTAPTRTLVHLSRGGADAVVVREFDLVRGGFVAESDAGFVLPEAKTRVAWQSADVLLVGTDVGAEAMTRSGYPRTVREWRRGTRLADAPVSFEGEASDVSVSGYVGRHGGVEYEWTSRGLDFYNSRRRLRRRLSPGDAEEWDEWRELQVPTDSSVGQFEELLLIRLRTEWQGHPAGSLLAAPAEQLAVGEESGEQLPVGTGQGTGKGEGTIGEGSAPELQVLFVPTERTAIDDVTVTRNKLILTLLDNVRARVLTLFRDGNGRWIRDEPEGDEPMLGGIAVAAVDADATDDVWLTTWSYTQPSRLHLSTAADGATAMLAAEPLRALPAMWDADGVEVTQGSATSSDGTPVPFFVIRPRAASAQTPTSTPTPTPQPQPTLLYGYGGFSVSTTPKYISTLGAAWVEEGGCYVEACIRGGGEFGPGWHQAALREKRHKAYEDFEAVAEELIAQGITTASQLACRGGSNGGLLVGNMLVRRPDLFGAVVCAVPLLDMRRYNKLLAGASWVAEYGDPDTTDWEEFLYQYSAYHQIDPEVRYPPILVTTSTRDDRVHPYHARCFVKRLLECGNEGCTTYYENIEGGHGGAADPKQAAFMFCLYIEFLRKTIAKGAM